MQRMNDDYLNDLIKQNIMMHQAQKKVMNPKEAISLEFIWQGSPLFKDSEIKLIDIKFGNETYKVNIPEASNNYTGPKILPFDIYEYPPQSHEILKIENMNAARTLTLSAGLFTHHYNTHVSQQDITGKITHPGYFRRVDSRIDIDLSVLAPGHHYQILLKNTGKTLEAELMKVGLFKISAAKVQDQAFNLANTAVFDACMKMFSGLLMAKMTELKLMSLSANAKRSNIYASQQSLGIMGAPSSEEAGDNIQQHCRSMVANFPPMLLAKLMNAIQHQDEMAFLNQLLDHLGTERLTKFAKDIFVTTLPMIDVEQINQVAARFAEIVMGKKGKTLEENRQQSMENLMTTLRL